MLEILDITKLLAFNKRFGFWAQGCSNITYWPPLGLFGFPMGLFMGFPVLLMGLPLDCIFFIDFNFASTSPVFLLCPNVLSWVSIGLHGPYGPHMLLWAFINRPKHLFIALFYPPFDLYGTLMLAISERNVPFVLV